MLASRPVNMLIGGLLLLVAGAIMFVAIMNLLPLGPDYFFHYRPLADQWLDGYYHIYDGDQERLFYPPWSLFVIIPLGLLPLKAGHAALFSASLLSILIGLRFYYKVKPFPRYFWLLTFVNLHTFDYFIRGQLDGPVLVGLMLGWWAVHKRRPLVLGLAFCLMTVKPPLNIVLPGLLYLLAIRHWSRRELVLVFSLPIAVFVVSTLMVGLDWPLVFINNLEGPVNYLSISLWRLVELLNWPVWLPVIPMVIAVVAFFRYAWREGPTDKALAIAVATNLLFTNYANGNHYLILIPALVYLARHNWRLALLAWIFTWTPITRLLLGYDAAVIDILYPCVLLLATWYQRDRRTQITASQSLPVQTVDSQPT